jgi:hypothetical protein
VSWRGLRYKGTERLTSTEWNTVIDALNDLYSQINSGTQNINVNTVNAVTANFQQRITAAGKAVLLDGDPITVSQFDTTAQGQITSAIDSSSLLSRLVGELQPVSASGSVAAADNTSGLSVVLNKGGRPNVNVYYSLGGAGTVTLSVSLDGNTWRTLKTYTLTGAGSGIDIIQGVAYPYVMLSTSATGIDVTLEVVASR